MNKQTVKDIDVTGKRVLVRCDFNVPLKDGKITDDTRIIAALPTIKYLIAQGAKIILCSHLGRPKGEFNREFSLQPVADYLAELLHKPVPLATDVVGEDAYKKAASLQNGDILLLENVRFEPGETKNDPELAKQFANLADVFVNDAFGSAHRAHASTVGVTAYLPAVAGFLMEKEINYLGKALEAPERPFVAILGGAKVSDKIGVIENLLEKVDTLMIGGGMAYTFIAAQGGKIGKSLVELDKMDLALRMLAQAKEKNVQLLLPVDSVVGAEFTADTTYKIVDSNDIPEGWMGLDIGPKAVEEFSQAAKEAKTVLWNGPMGVFEFPTFAAGTNAVAKAIAESGSTSIIGGGDSVKAVISGGFADKMTYISTGGGASLEFLEGKELPGVAALLEKQ